MRTVHEPEPFKGPGQPEPTLLGGKKGLKFKLTNGNGKPAPNPRESGTAYDEDGNEIELSPANDNITYIPAHHPLTGQPGFMIHYPPDIHFTAWESSIAADQLMRLLRRQVHWAQKEGAEIKEEVENLEQQKREAWTVKEILLEGILEAELSQADRETLLRHVDSRVREAMETDIQPAKKLEWTGGEPAWRKAPAKTSGNGREQTGSPAQRTPSPPPTGASGGFDGEADPYDNWLTGRMAEYEEQERLRNTPAKAVQEQQAAEADAAGALIGMSGGNS